MSRKYTAAEHRKGDWATISTILPADVIDRIGLREHDQDQALWMLRICNAFMDAHEAGALAMRERAAQTVEEHHRSLADLADRVRALEPTEEPR